MGKRIFEFEKLITGFKELEISGFDRHDPYCVASLTVHALMLYNENSDACISFLNFLKGHQELSTFDKQFLRDRFCDKGDYFIRSYFKGARPDNDYNPDMPYTIEVSDNLYSLSNDGYIKLFIKSGGADSPREIVMREKKSTGEWFLWRHEALLLSIRVPESADPWA